MRIVQQFRSARITLRNIIFPFFLFFVLYSQPLLFAQNPEEPIIRKYETAIKEAERLNIYQEDVLHILPKMQMAAQAIMNQNYAYAERLLEAAEKDLWLLREQMPVHSQRTFKLEWLEIYSEIFQKYAILALIAFLFTKTPPFRKWLKNECIPAKGKMYLVFLGFFSALFFSFFDVSRFGSAAWAFFDVQVVIVTICGLIGGVWPGMAAGFCVAAFRLVLSQEYAVYAAVAFAAGMIGGLGSRFIKTYCASSKASFSAGFGAGLFHGIAVYTPWAGGLSPFYIASSILFLSVLEGTAVFIFMAVTSGILHEEKQRETERELLTTKLLFLQAQIRPHFLFNALNTIAAVCSRENASGAHRLILRLAEFMRQAAKRFDDKISLKEEMNYVDAYLDLEKARFQERLKIQKEFSINEKTWNCKIPFLIVQPLV